SDGSLLPSSIWLRADGVTPICSASADSVRPRSVRRSRTWRPSLRRRSVSRPLKGKIGLTSGEAILQDRPYVSPHLPVNGQPAVKSDFNEVLRAIDANAIAADVATLVR